MLDIFMGRIVGNWCQVFHWLSFDKGSTIVLELKDNLIKISNKPTLISLKLCWSLVKC
jgi:hypothetical protein